ncbi:radical SAM protein [Kitasatospora sp. NPDC091335]|uniref:radical SAM protein n=1 Tax=Kitasatospora sp. NPDC091335 TaxID=3364085 RepID=UPI00380B91CA
MTSVDSTRGEEVVPGPSTGTTEPGTPSSTFIIKIAGACNLNCTYCYVYNLGDTTYESRPKVMSKAVAGAALDRIFEYARSNDLPYVGLALHGGEPTLVGKRWMAWFLDEVARRASGGPLATLSVQTNGTELDGDWLDIFAEHKVSIGISIDGPEAWHDQFRVNHAGRGSYRKVRQAIELLAADPRGLPWGTLTVANPDYPGTRIFSHLAELGVRNMDFLWPDHHHDMRPPWPAGALSRYYIELFDAWLDAMNPDIKIRWFATVIEMLLGSTPRIDAIGLQSIAEVVVEADGSLEPLDVLRVCSNGMTQMGLNVTRNSIDELRSTRLFSQGLRSAELLPADCLECPVLNVCGGGYLPHRWGNGRGFRNPSVHSGELRRTIEHIRDRVAAEFAAASARD